MRFHFSEKRERKAMRALLLCLCCMLAMLWSRPSLYAQEFRGTITGQVSDAGGAMVPNAFVTATSPEQTYRAKTTGKGDFTIPLVQPGQYTVSVEAVGFKKSEKSGVSVDVSEKLALTFTLDVGSVAETITVTADQAQVNTSDASGGSIIDQKEVENLPLNGRQMYSLLSLTPGVKTPPTGNAASELNESNNYSINGQWGNYNQFALNGAPVSQQNGGGAGSWNISPSVDSVEQFKVMTNTYDAQYGRSSGGTVNTILKSGSPNFHGTAYDFWRNTILDANSYSNGQGGIARPAHNQNQFGGTVGGPVIGKSTFFFFSYEGWREDTPNSINTTTITPDVLPGSDGSVNLTAYLAGTGKTAIYDPLTTRCATPGQNPCSQYVRDPFAGNIIPAKRISPIGLSLLKLLPLANQPGYSNNYKLSLPGQNSYNQPIIRVDHNFGDATRMYGMFAFWSGTQNLNSSGFPGAAGRGNINNTLESVTPVVDVTHTFKPTLFADLRLSYNRASNQSPNGAQGGGLFTSVTPQSLGLTMPAIPTTTHSYLPEINTDDGALPGFVGNQVSPSIFETYDIAPSITHVLGSNTLHYGGELSWYHDVANGIRQANGNFSFGPGFTQQNPRTGNNDGSTIADFLLGYPSGGGVEYNYPTYESYKSYALYTQDDWKVNRRFALNLGLRFENELSPTDRHGRLQAGICLTCINPISSVVPAVVLPNGASFAKPIMAGLEFQKDRSPYQNTWGILLPKFGASFSITNRLVMRGGWGMYRALGFELGGTSTWDTTTSYVSSLDDNLTPNSAFNSGNPYPNGFITPPGDSLGLASGNGDGIYEDSWNRKIPYTQQYSFGFQGEAPGGIVWDAEYVGARTLALRAGLQRDNITPAQWAAGNANPAYLDQLVTNPFYGLAGIPVASYLGSHPTVPIRNLMVTYPQYTGLYEWNTPQGYSNYSSLIAKADKRFNGGGLLSNGLNFTVAFTWSKLLSATGRLNNGLLADPLPFYGIDGSDRTFLFSFAGVYKLPIGKGGIIGQNLNGFMNEAVGGWQLNWILNDQSGTPVNFPNNYINTCGSYNIRPSSSSWGSYLNNSHPECFASFPEYTTVTQLPLSTAIRNPWALQTQASVLKQFPIHDNINLQFRAEAFNLTNTPIFNGPNTGSPNSPVVRHTNILASQPGAYTGYGTIGPSTQNSPRQLQLSLKVLF